MSRKSSLRSLIKAAVVSAIWVGTQGPAAADLINFGAASGYAVLGTGGTSLQTQNFEIYQSATIINGNVGVGPYSVWTHGMDATINGTLKYDPATALPSITGTITGGTLSMTMSGAAGTPVYDAFAAATAIAALTKTQTVTTLEGATITGTGGQNVIDVTGNQTVKTNLTVTGSASDTFIFRLGGDLTLSGMSITLNGVNASQILWYLPAGSALSISSGAMTAYGTFFNPYGSILVDNANVVGAVIGGTTTPYDKVGVSIHSTSSVTYSPFSPPLPSVPDGGSTLILLSFALLGTEGFRRWKQHEIRA